jgi:hypothetical protein
MVERDVVLAKVAMLDRCLARIADVRGPRSSALLPVDAEDIVVLNLRSRSARTARRDTLEASLERRLHAARRLSSSILIGTQRSFRL